MIIISNSSSKITRLNYWKTKKFIEAEKLNITLKPQKKHTEKKYVLGPKQRIMKKYEAIPTQERYYGHQQYIHNMKVYALRHTKYKKNFY